MNRDKRGLYFIRKMDECGRISIPSHARQMFGITEGDSVELICDNDQMIIKRYRDDKYFKPSAEKIIDSLYGIINLPVMLCDKNYILYSRGISEPYCKELSQDFFEQIRRNDANKYAHTPLNEDGTIQVRTFGFIRHNGENIGAVVVKWEPAESEVQESAVEMAAAAISLSVN